MFTRATQQKVAEGLIHSAFGGIRRISYGIVDGEEFVDFFLLPAPSALNFLAVGSTSAFEGCHGCIERFYGLAK